MTDIAKCKGTNCPLKETCYRYTAFESPYRQTYLTEVPYKDDKCSQYWNNSFLKPKKQ